MIKKLTCIFLLIYITINTPTFAINFSDVPEQSNYYKAASYLSERGIINGYENGEFGIEREITRAEAATIITRAMGLSGSSSKSILYSDVSKDFWGYNAIILASENGIINGMGDGSFEPDSKVTYNQIIKMVVCMLNLEDEAKALGGWPKGYTDVAINEGIIEYSLYFNVAYEGMGDIPAKRGDVANFIYNATKNKERDTLFIGDKKYTLGNSVKTLDTPDEILSGASCDKWYVYDTKSYENFFAAGITNGKIVALASSGKGFNYHGYKMGDKKNEDFPFRQNLRTDKNDNNIIHAVKITNANHFSKSANTSDAVLKGESKMNFHFTNAFRVYHGKSVLTWCDDAAKAAELHSQDMADNNYFAHDSLDGRNVGDRLTAQGIDWRGAGENIYGGDIVGFATYHGWVNSEGHRKNMLENFSYLGVGSAYKQNSNNIWYQTQAFYK